MLIAQQIREKIGLLMDRASAIADLSKGRELSPDEKTEIDKIIGKGGEIEVLNQDLERAETLERRQAEITARRINPVPVQSGGDSLEPDSPRVIVPAAARFRHSRLRAFKGADADAEAYSFGQWFLGSVLRRESSAKWCRDHGITIQAAMSEGTDMTGGYLVPAQFEQSIVDLRQEYGVARRICRVVPMNSDTVSVPVRSSGLTAYFVGENSEITASDKAWTQANLTARKLAALCKYSSELGEDAIISMADDLASEIAYAFANKEDSCVMIGDGTSTYGGIVGVKNALAAGSVYTAITGNTAFSTLDLADFESMIGMLPRYPGIQPRWVISQAGWAASMLRLLDAAGGNTVSQLQAGAQLMFLGYPVEISQVMNATLTAQTSTAGLLFFGDFRMAVLLGSRRGVTVMGSADRYFEYDQLAIKGTERFDAVCCSPGDASYPGAVVSLTTPGS